MNTTPIRIIPTDPLFSLQWHLLNTGTLPGSRAGQDINVVKVWPDYSGQGVLIGVMDDGVDGSHPDLIQNFQSDLSWDVFLDIPGGYAVLEDDNHGTSVSGLAAAAKNDVGGVGVAWGARFLMNRTPLDGDDDMLLSFQRAVDRMIKNGVDVSTNSWGTTPRLAFDEQASQGAYHQAVWRLAQEGRDGLGIVTLFAAGNSREGRMNTNYDVIDNVPTQIIVAAGNIDGTISSYSTPGATVLVTSPGSDPASIVTTDRQGEAGYNPAPGVEGNYTNTTESAFNGTSAAAPIAAGAVALILQANPLLGYRDVQEILVYSSKRAIFLEQNVDKVFNGSHDWNGGALLGSHDFGYGHIDTHAAVRMAETWTRQSTAQNQVVQDGVVAQNALNVAAGQTGQLVASFAADYRVEYMTVTLNLTTPTLQNVTIELISPDGTVSTLVNRPVFTPDPYVDDEPYPELPTTLNYTLATARSWGEHLQGAWTLRVSNADSGDTVQIQDWSIKAYAAAASPQGNTQVFTDEFAQFANLQADRVLLRADNGQNINAAAVTTDTTIDLTSSKVSLGGLNVNLDNSAAFRDLFTGDGNDTLVGNSTGNLLMAGRGNNLVDGAGGFDVMRFIGDRANYVIAKTEDGTALVNSSVLSGGGTDQLKNIELLHFADQAVLFNAPDVQGNDILLDEAAYLRANPDVAAAVDAGLTTALQHYERWGVNEGRNPNDLFDEAWYLTRNPDVAAAVQSDALTNGYQHYQTFGWSEGRSPAAWMNVQAYLQDNPDVAQAQANPLAHYLTFGYTEGRELPSWSADYWV